MPKRRKKGNKKNDERTIKLTDYRTVYKCSLSIRGMCNKKLDINLK